MLLLFVVVKGQKDHGLVLVNLAGPASLAVKKLSLDVESFSDNTGTHQVLFTASLASHGASKLRERWQNVSGVGCHSDISSWNCLVFLKLFS